MKKIIKQLLAFILIFTLALGSVPIVHAESEDNNVFVPEELSEDLGNGDESDSDVNVDNNTTDGSDASDNDTSVEGDPDIGDADDDTGGTETGTEIGADAFERAARANRRAVGDRFGWETGRRVRGGADRGAGAVSFNESLTIAASSIPANAILVPAPGDARTPEQQLRAALQSTGDRYIALQSNIWLANGWMPINFTSTASSTTHCVYLRG